MLDRKSIVEATFSMGPFAEKWLCLYEGHNVRNSQLFDCKLEFITQIDKNTENLTTNSIICSEYVMNFYNNYKFSLRIINSHYHIFLEGCRFKQTSNFNTLEKRIVIIEKSENYSKGNTLKTSIVFDSYRCLDV